MNTFRNSSSNRPVTTEQIDKFSKLVYNIFLGTKSNDKSTTEILLKIFNKIQLINHTSSIMEIDTVLIPREDIISAIHDVKLIKKIYKL